MFHLTFRRRDARDTADEARYDAYSLTYEHVAKLQLVGRVLLFRPGCKAGLESKTRPTVIVRRART